jgi:Na+-transporting methylmalonyl-CoA/oxaloacetate decarboxylase gamma subunit
MMTQIFDKRYYVPQSEMHIVPIAWMFVVVLMTIAEATSTQGTLLGAFFTFVLYGLLPLAIVMYVLGAPGRRRARRAAEAAEAAEIAEVAEAQAAASAGQGNAGSHAPGDRRAPVREEP